MGGGGSLKRYFFSGLKILIFCRGGLQTRRNKGGTGHKPAGTIANPAKRDRTLRKVLEYLPQSTPRDAARHFGILGGTEVWGMESGFGGGRGDAAQTVHQKAKDGLGEMEGVVVAVVVDQEGDLLDGVHVEDAAGVDHVFPSEAHEILVVGEFLVHGGLHLGQAEGYHEMCSRRIIDMRVMVIRLKIHDPVQVYDEEFAIHTET